MDEVSARLVVPVTCIMTILDGAMLGLLTLVTGGFDSILYWAFLGLLVRNAAVIPSADVQITVNFLVSLCYLLAGILDIWVAGTELELIRTTGRGTVSGGFFDENQVPITESLILRMLLMLLLTACCAGIQILVDRQRQREFDAQEFQIKQQQLEAAGRLAADIAHQLKNPLGIINNAAFTLQRTVKEGKKITQQISIIREEVDRSDKILTELMGYARLSEGRVERVDIIAEVDRAVDLVLPTGANFEIKIHRDYAPGLPALLGQQGHFAEVFANLLTNAREAMDGKGEIYLTTRTGPEFSVVVSIRDTGPGIPTEQLKSIFEPYFTTKNRGTGLGLAIVKNNTELYGGTVAVESELGKGTMFTLTLPARSLIRLRS
jgi:signal transduction histidine kinase